MPRPLLGLLLGLLLGPGTMLWGACGDDASPGPDADLTDAAAPDAGNDAAVHATSTVVLFHTSDEHGWMQPYQATAQSGVQGGIANLYSWWVEREGLDPASDLILSGGDHWTGPSISTWFAGEPMVEAFNRMGYAASALGNHEFDFGRLALALRAAEASFPFLAANVTYSATGGPLEGIEPWILVEAGDVQVGILGLAGQHTATSANPIHVGDLTFGDYAAALDVHLPALREAGAQVVVLLTHLCAQELGALLSAEAPAVDVAFAGHCHQLYTTAVGGIPIVSSGAYLRAYTVTTLTYDWRAQAVTDAETRIVEVAYGAAEPNPVTPDAELLGLVDRWQAAVDAQLGLEIGFTAAGIAQGSSMMGNWVTDAWLWAFPQADVAVTNYGGLRQSIAAGKITLADLVGMMPFDNTLYLLEITGAELVANLQQAVDNSGYHSGGYPAVGGMSFSTMGGVVQVTLAGGAPLDLAALYRVLTIDYLVFGGNGYLFGAQDPAPYDTSENYRQPVIDWTESIASSEASPLEGLLDGAPRD